MKKLISILIFSAVLFCSPSCKKDSADSSSGNSIGTDPSPMGAAGTTVSSSSAPIAGVSDLNAIVTSLANGVSSYSGSGVVTNATIKNILANFPQFTISGDNVSVTDFQFRQTLGGIECLNSIGPGIIVNYNSSVGATYTVGTTGRTRTVVAKSTDDDYSYGMLLIKVVQVEEPTPSLKSVGVSKVTYWANHKFGLVGVQYNFTDGTTAKFPVYCSTSNSK